MTRFAELPPDVLSYLLSFCGLADVVRFLQLCSASRALTQTRAIWIDALRRERNSNPITCAFHEDLSTHDIDRLRAIAFHTLRLAHNWSLPEPQVIGPIRVIKLPADGLDIIFQIPATDLYLIHSRFTGFVQVWDVEIGKPVSEQLYISKRIMDVSPGMEDVGVYAMAFLVSDIPMEEVTATNLYHTIKLIQVEYGPSGVNLSIPFVGDSSPSLYLWAVFLTQEIVGVLQCNPLDIPPPDQPSTMDIVAYNLKTRHKTTIQTDIERNEVTFDHQSGTSVQDGNVNILIEYKSTSSVFCCPRAYFPTDDNPGCPKEQSIKLANTKYRLGFQWPHRPGRYTEPEGALSADPMYGVPAVSIHMHYLSPDVIRQDPVTLDPEVRDSGDIPYAMQVRFWTTGLELETQPNWILSGQQPSNLKPNGPRATPTPPSSTPGSSPTDTQKGTGGSGVGNSSETGRPGDMATREPPVESSVEENDEDWTPTIIKPIYIAVVPGSLSDSTDSCWQLMLIPRSGRKALLVVQEREEDGETSSSSESESESHGVVLKLKMASLDWDQKRTSVHTLSVPSFIDLRLIYGLSMDDHKGVVTLVDTRGYLYVLPYA